MIDGNYSAQNISMKLNDIPDRKAKGCSERITFAITPEAKNYLKRIKAADKDPAELVRMLLDNFIKHNPIDTAA